MQVLLSEKPFYTAPFAVLKLLAGIHFSTTTSLPPPPPSSLYHVLFPDALDQYAFLNHSVQRLLAAVLSCAGCVLWHVDDGIVFPLGRILCVLLYFATMRPLQTRARTLNAAPYYRI